MESSNPLVIILGAGDLASGVAHRLFKCHFRVIMTELPQPLVVRRAVSFAEAIYSDEIVVERVIGKKSSPDEALRAVDKDSDFIPVLIDPNAEILSKTNCDVLVDARMAKRNLGITRDAAPLVIGLGPGFEAGVDVHKVIETRRGHNMGRVIDAGTAEANTGIPEPIMGNDVNRVVKSSTEGTFHTKLEIGSMINEGDIIGKVDNVEIKTELSGLLRGLIHNGVLVTKGTKLGDIDPRGELVNFKLISDKSRAVGGGVLEAILSDGRFRIESNNR